jgi:hypothetical protein
MRASFCELDIAVSDASFGFYGEKSSTTSNLEAEQGCALLAKLGIEAGQ